MRTNETAGLFQPLDFERSLDDYDIHWITHGSVVPPVALSICYVIMIVVGPKMMENRKGYNLRGFMTLWSLGLAVYSIMGSYRMLEAALYTTLDSGIRGVVCTGVVLDKFPVRFWTITFLLSKFLEYGDTALIILRKQKLIFLHWYHHLTVALFVWYSAHNNYGGSNLFITVNLTVHAFMYSYYTIKAAGYRLPRFVNIFITTLQITQMVIGCSTIGYLMYSGPKEDCKTSIAHVASGGLMYATYLYLFAQFFYKTYFAKRPQKLTSQNGTSMTSQTTKKLN
uniref:elongation of very long chain fatty acids protein 3-like isoform X1 n=1 Tax=Ciona intestinalis TaxID=7719 RepID=UPI0000522280|nr:elongation of very long chain fatty acids protein 3-like isoform X1 [Ciona intestinalis]|eukprot:XP_002119936.2 elongation of very long chain fatty acids protein 3-like isoform X1 [Ciona intestinalis]